MTGDHPFGRVSAASLVAIAAFALTQAFATAPARADEGSTIFASKCAACHTIGKGKTVGPDLKGITSQEDPAWLKRWIASPSTLVKENDPEATRLVKQYPLQMPDLGLSSPDIDAVLAYIAQQSGNTRAAVKGPAPATVALPQGDAGAGRELFVGRQSFKNGGPPCMSCHSISGIGALGGGTLGPDLTDAYQKYGGTAGLASFLTSVPTPTMSAVWTKHPLTPPEIANLVAFIKEGAVAQRPPGQAARLLVLAVIGVIVLVVIGAVYWRRRLVNLRKSLVARANTVFTSKYAGRL